MDKVEEKLSEEQTDLRDEARKKGQRKAREIIRKVDSVFHPRNLDPDDAKVLFNPADYVVFNGMKAQFSVKEIVFLDRETASPERATIQKSIRAVLERGHYEWLTIRVGEDGSITEEDQL